MQSYSVREVVEMAVRTEKMGHEFYTGMADKFSQDKAIGDLFTLLATMEVKHERIFKGLLERISDTEPNEWEEAQNYLRAMMESEFFLGSGKSLPQMDKIATIVNAVDFALGFEKETTLFFVGMRDSVSDADRHLVDEIIKEETLHIAMLTKFRAAL